MKAIKDWLNTEHETRVDNKFLVKTSLAMMGITINMILVATVLGVLVQTRPAVVPVLAGLVKYVVSDLALFAVSTLLGVLGEVIVAQKWRNRFWALSFGILLSGVAVFLVMASWVISFFTTLTG